MVATRTTAPLDAARDDTERADAARLHRRRALALGVLAAGVIVGAAMFADDQSVITLVAAGLVGIVVAVTAGTHFWYMLLGIYVVRSTLDGFKTESGSNGL